MLIETIFTKATGVAYPVMQGGMQWVGIAQLTAAVSNAGGLGVLTALTQPTPADLEREILKVRKLTTKVLVMFDKAICSQFDVSTSHQSTTLF